MASNKAQIEQEIKDVLARHGISGPVEFQMPAKLVLEGEVPVRIRRHGFIYASRCSPRSKRVVLCPPAEADGVDSVAYLKLGETGREVNNGRALGKDEAILLRDRLTSLINGDINW